jgi:type I restriction enzyme S subunit
MKRYESYKPLSELWLSSIPTHWNSRKIKYLFSERSEKGYPDEPLLVASQNMGVVPKHIYGNRTVEAMKDLHLLKLVRVGDFVISLRSFQGGIEYAYYQGIISPAYTIMIPKDMIVPQYFKYLAKSRLFIELLQLCVTGIREGQNIDYSKLKNHQIPVPPRSEQDQIVRYLDWQVSKINKLIAAKKKEIAVLEEYKQTAIDEAVTKGISNHDFVTSNVDWIEQIPSSWKLKKIKEYFSFGKGLSITKANLVEEGIPVISYGQVHSKRNTGVKVEQHLLRYVPDTYLELSPNALVNKGDFIFADTSEDYLGVGNCVYIDVTNTLFAGYHTIIARSKHNENGKFFAYLFRSSAWRYQIRKRVNGVKVYSITQKILGTASVLIPPKNEQAEIVEYLDDICGRVDAIIENLYKRIDIFHEYRTRLISDVVTGQIDVRGIEIPDYEYVEEESDEETDETEGADEEVEEQEE